MAKLAETKGMTAYTGNWLFESYACSHCSQNAPKTGLADNMLMPSEQYTA